MSNDNGEKETRPTDVLDEIKKVEQTVRRRALAKSIGDMKDKAKKILELKEETVAMLEALGISDVDSKRVIDFLNSCPDVQLTENDKKSIRERANDNAKKQKQEVVKKINDAPITYYPAYTCTTGSSTIMPGGNDFYTTTASFLNTVS